jgi:hypothetical protein
MGKCGGTGEQVEEECSTGKNEDEEDYPDDADASFYAGKWSLHVSVPGVEVYEEKTAASGWCFVLPMLVPAGLPVRFGICCNNQFFLKYIF